MKKKLLVGLMAFAVLFSSNLCIAKAEEVQGEELTAATLEEIPFNSYGKVLRRPGLCD